MANIEIPQKGVIKLNAVNEKFFPNYSENEMTYFAPSFNPQFRGSYQPASSFAIGESLLADFSISLRSRKKELVYNTDYAKFGGQEFAAVAKFQMTKGFYHRFDNAILLIQQFYQANGYDLAPNLYDAQIWEYLKSPILEANGAFNFSTVSLDRVGSPVSGYRGLRVLGMSLQSPNAEPPFCQVYNDRETKFPPYIRQNARFTEDQLYQEGKFWLSNDAEKASEGYFEGEINLNIPCFTCNVKAVLDPDTGNMSYHYERGYDGGGGEEEATLKVKIHVEAQATFVISEPEMSDIYLYNDGQPTLKRLRTHNVPQTGQVNNVNFFAEHDKANDLTRLVYHCGTMMSGNTARNLYSIYAHEIWTGVNLITTEYWASPFFAGSDVYANYFDNAANPQLWASFLYSYLNTYALSYGAMSYYENYFINGFNLNVNEKRDYIILKEKQSFEDYPLYSFNNRLYTAIVDYAQNDLIIILNDGSGYFNCNLNKISPRNYVVNCFVFDSENNQFLLGFSSTRSGADPNLYFLVDYELIMFMPEINKLVYNFNKIGLTFIPCHTHCMGKGGITSKV